MIQKRIDEVFSPTLHAQWNLGGPAAGGQQTHNRGNTYERRFLTTRASVLISGQVVQQCGGHSDDSVLCAIKLYTVASKKGRNGTRANAPSQVSTKVAVDHEDDGLAVSKNVSADGHKVAGAEMLNLYRAPGSPAINAADVEVRD